MRRLSPSIVGVVCVVSLLVPVRPAGAAVSATTGTRGAGEGSSASAGQPDEALKKKLRQALKWAQKPAVQERRMCRSGNNYRLDVTGYSGGYGLSGTVWKRFGGREFAKAAHKATKSEQSYVARKYVAKAGLDAIGCDTDDWMRRVYANAGDTPLSKMLIPGTHDSGTAGIRTEQPCSTQFVDDPIGALLKKWSTQNPCVFAGLYQSQNLTLAQQLQAGVRYLDLRVGIPADQVLTSPPSAPAADPTDVPFVLAHKLIAEPLTEALAGVQRFIAKHPREQIILDFQEFNLPKSSDPNKPVDPAVVGYYKGALDRLLRTYAPGGGTQPICESAWASDVITAPDDRLGRDVPIKQAWRKKVSAILYFKEAEIPAADPCYRKRWAGGGFLYPNAQDPAKSTSDNLGYLQERKRRIASGQCFDDKGNNYCDINVSQLQLTPGAGEYNSCTLNPGPQCSLRYYAGLVNGDVVDNIRSWRFGAEKLPVNIAMVDYIDDSDPGIADSLIEYNWRIAGR